MIEEILPAEAMAVDTFEDPPGATLYPEEEARVARAVDKRRREFTTARFCARAALARLGLPPAPILPGTRGAPTWPDGVVGSMTHCDGYRAAVVARDTDLLTVGIDAEPGGPLPDGVLDAVSDEDERAWIAKLTVTEPWMNWDKLLFSAKESVYKAWFPLTGRWLDFTEATLTVDPADRTFSAGLLVPGPVVGDRTISGFQGRWMAGNGLVVTAIAVPA